MVSGNFTYRHNILFSKNVTINKRLNGRIYSTALLTWDSLTPLSIPFHLHKLYVSNNYACILYEISSVPEVPYILSSSKTNPLFHSSTLMSFSNSKFIKSYLKS